MLDTYSIQLSFGINIKELTFKTDNNDNARNRWYEACKTVDTIVSHCDYAKEFFEEVLIHYSKYGFELVSST